MPHSDPTADAFMRRILANPPDPVPRLVFADWLEESGASPNLAWARYIRLADELAAAPADDPRRPKMTQDLERVGSLVRARLTFRAEMFVAYPEAMLQLMPPRSMRVKVESVLVPRSLLDLVPHSLALYRNVLPLALVGRALVVALSEMNTQEATQMLTLVLNRDIVPFCAPERTIRSAVERNYGALEFDDFPPLTFESPARAAYPLALAPSPADPIDAAAPGVRFLNLLITEAINTGAEAVDLEPSADFVRVWFNRRGERTEHDPVHSRWLIPICTRIRVVAGLPLRAEEVSQVGVMPFTHRGLRYDLPVRLTSTPDGPFVRITITPAPENPPVALSQAA
ncbi:TIGR02996 domain-containing protein [Fimbriiglobus ruber]|uniref:General secretion pathway protein E n=1 Tax=Fimbriiglobus ruber TaxID=1908690 RepID=A0A225DJD7_9BACT|nr:TIGR02996 domain-containing protein [Fimbriiglobus ruber]OWK36505.1 General secretion pathway protein E [Fimbriiglobus ruber]